MGHPFHNKGRSAYEPWPSFFKLPHLTNKQHRAIGPHREAIDKSFRTSPNSSHQAWSNDGGGKPDANGYTRDITETSIPQTVLFCQIPIFTRSFRSRVQRMHAWWQKRFNATGLKHPWAGLPYWPCGFPVQQNRHCWHAQMQEPIFTLPLPGKSCNYCILHCSWQHWTWPIFSFFDIFGFSQRHNHTLSHHAHITPFIHTLFWRQMPSNRECCSIHCCGRCLALCCASHWWGQWGTALSHAASGKGDMNVMDLQAPPPTGQSWCFWCGSATATQATSMLCLRVWLCFVDLSDKKCSMLFKMVVKHSGMLGLNIERRSFQFQKKYLQTDSRPLRSWALMQPIGRQHFGQSVQVFQLLQQESKGSQPAKENASAAMPAAMITVGPATWIHCTLDSSRRQLL